MFQKLKCFFGFHEEKLEFYILQYWANFRGDKIFIGQDNYAMKWVCNFCKREIYERS